jgi:hypothetical protein
VLYTTFRELALLLTVTLLNDGDWTTGWTSGVQFPAGAVMGFFSLRHRIHTGSEVHPASYPMRTGGSYPGGKGAGA